jgi:hypothetical protein
VKELRESLAAVSTSSGAKTYLKAVRFDGTNNPGVLLNSLVSSNSEESLLSHLNEWELSLKAKEVEVPNTNVFRVILGDGSMTHLF